MYAALALATLALAQEPPHEKTPGRASAGRFVVSFLGSGLIGGAAAYGTLAASCGDEICLGGAVGGALVNIGVTPLAAWGLGRAMGGRGDLGMTYVGGLLPFTATAPISVSDPGTAMTVSMALMPVTSALVFELSSHVRSLGPVQTVQLAPMGEGARVSVGGAF